MADASAYIATTQTTTTVTKSFAQLKGYSQIVGNPSDANITITLASTDGGAEVVVINKSSLKNVTVSYTDLGDATATTVVLTQYDSFHVVIDSLGNFFPVNPIMSFEP